MADFAEMIISGAQKSAATQGDGMAEALNKGAQLAIAAEENQTRKAAALKQQADLKAAALDKFTAYLFKASEAKDPNAKKNYLKMAPRVRDTYGIDPNVFSDEAIAAFGASDDDAGRAYTLAMAVKDPNDPLFGKGEEAARIFNNPEERLKITPTPIELRGASTADLSASVSAHLEYQGKQQQLKQQADQFASGQNFQKSKFNSEQKDKLSNAIKTENITNLRTGFNRLYSLVPGFADGKVDGKDLGGVTGIAAKIPPAYLADKNSEVRQAALGILNDYLKSASGQSITASELPRLAATAGMTIGPLEGGGWVATVTGTPSPKAFVTGMKGIESKLKATEGRLKRTYGADMYREVTSGDSEMNAPGKQPAAPVTVTGDKNAGNTAAADVITNAVNAVKARFPDLTKIDKAKLTQSLTAAGRSGDEVKKILASLGIK